MTTKYEIPPELRAWCKATAPTYKRTQWEHAEWAVARDVVGCYHGPGRRIAEYRALLAYRDEVAAGLSRSGDDATSLARVVRGERPVFPSSKWLRLSRAGFVSDTGEATDYGRYIAGRAAALRGDS